MFARITTLLGGRANLLARWLDEPGPELPLLCTSVIAVGGGLYGATVGSWRAPEQALYTAIKFPCLVFLTCGSNALLNGMLAQVLGLQLSFRQTTQTILMSFTLAALILCAFSPVMLFLLWNTPALGERQPVAHSLLLASHVGVIAFAGIIANWRLLRLLERLSTSAAIARSLLFCWLAGNLFLGSQLAWVLRPFVGSPGLPIEFLRDHPWRGNFFESVFRALRHL
jgi:hypothetical protein